MTQHPRPVARRMVEFVEPIGLIPYLADEPNTELLALGFTDHWDTYFAGRAAPFGRDVPAEVVHAAFYNFDEREVARHIPSVWEVTTPAAALAARERGCVAGLRAILGPALDDPAVARAAELLTLAATSAPVGGRPLYAALRSLPVPAEPVARLWHAATLLREHRGDGHVAALLTEGVGGVEAHVLQARFLGVTDQQYGRAGHHRYLPEVLEALRRRGILDADGGLTDDGRALRERVETLTDRLAEAPYAALTPAEVDELAEALAPVAAPIRALLPW